MGVFPLGPTRGRNAVGDRDKCRVFDEPINETFRLVTLRACRLDPGVYYYGSIWVSGLGDALDGTLAPPVEVYVPPYSNSFSEEPRLLATPVEDVKGVCACLRGFFVCVARCSGAGAITVAIVPVGPYELVILGVNEM